MSSTIKLGDLPPPCNAPSGGPGGVEGCPTCKRQNWSSGKLVVLDVDSWKMGEGELEQERFLRFAKKKEKKRKRKQVKKLTSPLFLALAFSSPFSPLPRTHRRKPRLALRPLGLRLLLLLQQIPGGRGLRGPDRQRLHLLRQPQGLRGELDRKSVV